MIHHEVTTDIDGISRDEALEILATVAELVALKDVILNPITERIEGLKAESDRADDLERQLDRALR